MQLTQQQIQQQIQAKLQKIWGYSSFRPPQGEIVQALIAKQDALIVMATGGGKSICFQLPALMTTGLTLVVSPLVALMENQVQELRQRQLPVASLHSELSSDQRRKILWLLEKQRLRLLYLSPETLLTPPVWERLCQPELVINGLILDEAHCLVQWGETFRPAYRRLGAIRSALLQTKPPGTEIPIAAFTATADPQAQQTIREVLDLRHPQLFLQSPYRSNLHLTVQVNWTAQGRRQRLLKYIQARSQQSGLVYVRTRRDSEALADWLNQQGYITAAYHAGLGAQTRRQIEAGWIEGAIPLVVCTSAFGMGINKPNVRFVVHFHAPLLLSEYVQEVGRAGRDGQSAEALTLISEPSGWFDPDDRQRQQFFQAQMRKQQQMAQQLSRKVPIQGNIAAVTRQFKEAGIALSLLHSQGQLHWQDPFHYQIDRSTNPQPSDQNAATRQMAKYLQTKTCRWQFLLNAFGFETEAMSLSQPGCGHCDRCLKKVAKRTLNP